MRSSNSQIAQLGLPQPPDEQLPRRSACDRCRAHKLRCPRVESRTDGLQPCLRCSKAGVTCTTGVPLRSGRPSKSAKEKRRVVHGASELGDGVRSDSTASLRPELEQSSIPSISLSMDFETSPLWLLDWDNIAQQGNMRAPSNAVNASTPHHPASGGTSTQDYNPLEIESAVQASNYPGTDELDFAGLLNMNPLGQDHDDGMDIEAYGNRPAHQVGSENHPYTGGEISTISHVEPIVDIPETFLEKIDLKEEVLRRLADLQSALLADLNLIRDVGKCPCKQTDRVSLASSQRAADGKTEEYNFLIGRMLNNAEAFASILHCINPAATGKSAARLGVSETGSDASDKDQDIMNAFTSWQNNTTPNEINATSFEAPTGLPIHCDVPMMLSILTCYVFLTRIYRTLFSTICVALTVAKERNMELPPLFPGLKLGGFAPPMSFQVQILIQIGTNLLDKIDEALGLPHEHGGTKQRSGILDQTGSAAILRTMMKEEAVEELENGDPSKESPREIMRSISRLL